MQRKLKHDSSQGGWLVSKKPAAIWSNPEILFFFEVEKRIHCSSKRWKWTKREGESFFFVRFSWFCWKMKKLNVVWFYFFIPMVFGLIRPWFCYVTFLKIPYSLRKFLQFLWFFWESFLEKSHHGTRMDASMIFILLFSCAPIFGLYQ